MKTKAFEWGGALFIAAFMAWSIYRWWGGA
jgi:hypothetical protein